MCKFYVRTLCYLRYGTYLLYAPKIYASGVWEDLIKEIILYFPVSCVPTQTLSKRTLENC